MRTRVRAQRVTAFIGILALLLGGVGLGSTPAAASTPEWCEPGGEHDGTLVSPGDSIQAAIDTAAPGLIICVEPGTYPENLTVDVEGITLWSMEYQQAEIQGTVVIEADGVHLDSFKVTNFSQIPAPDWAGVYVPSGVGVVVSKNLIDGEAIDPAANLTVGVHTLFGGEAEITVEENNVQNVRLGVYNQGAEMTIDNNLLQDTTHTAIGVDTDLGTTIGGNVIRNGDVFGVEAFRENVDIFDNDFEGNHVGVWGDAENITVRFNNFTGNDYGVVTDAASPTIDAVGNWWGSLTGPSTRSPTSPNPIGTGDEAWGNVSFFPWCLLSDCPVLRLLL